MDDASAHQLVWSEWKKLYNDDRKSSYNVIGLSGREDV